MNLGRTHGWFPRMIAALVSAAVFITSFGPGTAALAANLHPGTQGNVRPIPSASVHLPPISLNSGVSAPLSPPLSAKILPFPAVSHMPLAVSAQAQSPLAPVVATIIPATRPEVAARLDEAARLAASSPDTAAPLTGIDSARNTADELFHLLTGEKNRELPELTDPAVVEEQYSTGYPSPLHRGGGGGRRGSGVPPAGGRAHTATGRVYENWAGFRSVRGDRPDGRKALAAGADVPTIVNALAGRLNLAPETVVAIAAASPMHLGLESSREQWLVLYDRLDSEQEAAFAHEDAGKQHVKLSELANPYAEGWRGIVRRTLNPAKTAFGLVRLLYGPLDMFFFGRFRRPIAYRLFHANEDFLGLSRNPQAAEQWLAQSLERQRARGPRRIDGLRSNKYFRHFDRYGVRLVVKPLVSFILARVKLAIYSAIAVGILAAFAPFLPMSFALLSISYIGPLVAGLLHGLPVGAAMLPYVGSYIAPVVAAAVQALAREMVLGVLLQTGILCFLVTYQQAVGSRAYELARQHGRSKASLTDRLRALDAPFASTKFLRSYFRMFLGLEGMLFVGAEIDSAVASADQLDRGINEATGLNQHVFHAVVSAVEKPMGESSLAFGGAISWGNSIVLAAENAVGYSISDKAMHGVQHLLGLTRAPEHVSATEVVHTASSQKDANSPVEPDYWKQALDASLARFKLMFLSADPPEPAALRAAHNTSDPAVSTGLKLVAASAADQRAPLPPVARQEARGQGQPATVSARAPPEALVRELGASRDAAYIQAKLAQGSDLDPANVKARQTSAEVSRLKALQAKYGNSAPPPVSGSGAGGGGEGDRLAALHAGFKALSLRLPAGDGSSSSADALRPIDPELKARIEELVGEIESQRAAVSAEMTQSEATQNLLRAANAIRNRALQDRRDGRDMMRFHTDFAKLATVMDLALSLNELAAAQSAIKDMMDLLEAKRAAIIASQKGNHASEGTSAADLAQVEQYKADVQKALDADKSSRQDMVDLEAQTAQAASRISSFQEQINALIVQINAADKAKSPDALTEYARRLALLPQVAEWRTNGGNPNDPNAFSLKTFKDDVVQVDDFIKKAQDGLTRINTAPIEFAGVLIIAVPGPDVHLSNPTREQTLQMLAARRTYWRDQGKTYQGNLDTVNRMMDPNNVNIVLDEFGDAHPESLPKWRAQAAADFRQSQAAMNAGFTQLDAIAQKLNALTGSSIPLLSGRSLTDVQTEVKTYGDKLKAVKFPPNVDTPESRQAKLDLILAAQLTPYAIREVIRSSYDQAVMEQIDKALATTLPAARTGLQGVMNMMASIDADVDADVAFVNTGAGGGQALIDRKTALLRDTILPGLKGARTMLTDTLIPYQQDAIKSSASTPDSNYFKYYDGKGELLRQTQKAYKETVPWALASFGGSPDDVPGSLADIDAWKKSLQKYVDGYDDASGHHQGVAEYQKDMADRQCQTGCTRTETLYGQQQPYSLPLKISQYGQERSERATQINSQAATVNEILGKITAATGGKYHLDAYILPTGVGTDSASVARVQKIVDQKIIQNLGDLLKRIADEAQAAGGSGTAITVGGGGTVPVGVQPSPTASPNQMIALLALEAGKRLVPTSLAQPESAPAAFAVARYLYSDAVVNAATDARDNQVPKAVAFINRASAALSGAIAQTATDVAYVNSGGASESADAVYARKTAMFRSLDGMLKEGVDFFGLKMTWDQDAFATINKVNTYYDSVHTIYTSGSSVNINELTALDTVQKTLQDTSDGLETTRKKVVGWMAQLNPREQSAMSRLSEDVSRIQERTRAVLEANMPWHDLNDQQMRSQQAISAGMSVLEDRQGQLQALLDERFEDVQDRLDPETVRRIEKLRLNRNSFAVGQSGAETQALVIKKSEYSSFLGALTSLLTQGSQAISQRDLAAIKADLLRNPLGLAGYIPGSTVVDSGDTADGFYLVYQSNFSVPRGLETGSLATLGNVAKVWGQNLSISGYAFNSPPSPGPENAPFSDRGLDFQIESLGGRNNVNYLNIGLHRFGFDIPPDNSALANARESRLLVFDDFAAMLLGDKLYIGLAGYGDFALDKPGEHVSYFGGNAKASIKLSEVMRLNAEQRVLFAKDPRKFLEDVNLDFTGYDPSLNKTFRITASGDDKENKRTQIGPSVDINRLLNPNGGGDTFTLDLFYAKTSGTDDINQTSAGATLLNGFTIKNDTGKTWLRLDNRLTAEHGSQAGKLTDRLTAMLPERGITINADMQKIGGHSVHYLSTAKKTGDSGEISVGYGSQSIGELNRFRIALRDSFTLGDLRRTVMNESARALQGGDPLKEFNGQMAGMFDGDATKRSRTVAELKKVFEADAARRLVTQGIGVLSRDIGELRKAGLFLDNTRVRGAVGFTSRAVSNDQADLAIGGGFTTGAYTELTLNKTQKELIRSKAASLYREGMRLQDRLLQTTKDWQEAVVAVAQAQWDIRLAQNLADRAPSELLAAEARVALTDAQAALHDAMLRYNSISGREANATPPFEDLDPRGLTELLAGLGRLIAAPDAFTTILRGLDRDQLAKEVSQDPMNVLDWIPGIQSLSAGFGVQYQDMMASQALTVGISVRIPVYDPSSKTADHAYYLESEALNQEVSGAMQARRLALATERARARAALASAEAIAARADASGPALDDARRRYQNGLMSADEFRAARDAWRWYSTEAFKARSAAALAAAQAAIDTPLAPEDSSAAAPTRVSSLADAFAQARLRSADLAEVAARLQAAEDMARAQNHRVQRFWIDLGVGTGITSTGLGWIPRLGLTGIPITPNFGFELKPEELRELQVRQHEGQRDYYQALTVRLEAGLAAQFYQTAVAYRAAQARVALYDGKVLPELGAATGPDAARRADAARLQREEAQRVRDESKAILNLLLGRSPEADLALDFDADTELKALEQLLASRSAATNERAILQARVKVARAVEEMVDKDLKVDVLRLESVSLIVRTFGRLLGAINDGPIFNAENAAAARVATVQAERALEADAERRRLTTGQLRRELGAQISELDAIQAKTDSDSAIRRNAGEAKMYQLKARLMALGESPDAPRAPRTDSLPASWTDVRRRLAETARSAAADTVTESIEIPAPEVRTPRSGAFVRYYIAKQTLGHVPIDKNFIEGWIELRLRDPNTPPEILLALAKIQQEKVDRLHKMEMAAATARAEVMAARFENDVRLLRWARSRGADAAAFERDLRARIDAQRDTIAAILGLNDTVTTDALCALVPEDAAGVSGLREMAERTITDMRRRQIDTVRRTLFEGGLPGGFGGPDAVIEQIKAITIAERMSYKGFTPVLAAGVFRGTKVFGTFLEAPDPRNIERALEKLISDDLRKQLESDGRMREVALGLNRLMTRVLDGAQRLEAQRQAVAGAEDDLRARTVEGDPARVQAASDRLTAAWTRLNETMIDTKSAFITLVTELEATGQSSAGSLRPFAAPLTRVASPYARDKRAALLDFWTERMTDAAFAVRQDAALAQMSPAVTPIVRERVIDAGEHYRQALAERDKLNSSGLAPAQRMSRLAEIDVAGRRQDLRDAVTVAIRDLGAVDATLKPVGAAGLSAFVAREAQAAADVGATDLGAQRSAERDMRRALWGGARVPVESRSTFVRLENLQAGLDEARQRLLASVLADGKADPTSFLARDLQLDEYLKAQSAFDAELVLALETPLFANNPRLVAVLQGIHPITEVLERSLAKAQYGRGIAALDALIMIEKLRLRAGRAGGLAPAELDRIAASQGRLEETRVRWTSGKNELEPVYALVRVEGGRRTWNVDGWWTPADLRNGLKVGRQSPGGENAVAETPDGYIINNLPGHPGVRYEVVGGVDAAAALREGAGKLWNNQRETAALDAALQDPKAAFVKIAPRTSAQTPTEYGSLDYKSVFGAGGLAESGRVFFFEAGGEGRALHPISALSRPPEQVTMMVYDGDRALRRDRFPNIASLRQSDEADNFDRLVVTATGAAELKSRAENQRRAQWSRGWFEVALNSHGFARDASGVTKLYLNEAEFSAEWKSFDNAAQLLDKARKALAAAETEREKLKALDARAQAALDQAAARLRDQRDTSSSKDARQDANSAAYRVLTDPGADGVEAREFAAAVRGLLDAPDAAAGQKALDLALKERQKISQRYQEARTQAINAGAAVVNAQVQVEHASAWTLHRTAELSLGLDADKRVVSAQAPAARGAGALSESLASPSSQINGLLTAAIVDEDGRLLEALTTPAQVEAASAKWKRVSDTVNGRVAMDVEGRAPVKARFSHYEAPVAAAPGEAQGRSQPVMISRRYLSDQLTASQSRLDTANHWAIMPYNWLNIVLAIPRDIIQAPIELITGRDSKSTGYFGRAQMYKTEGGRSDHHGAARAAIGWLDVFNFLPDPITRWYDPSQFPDQVQIEGRFSPGRNLADLLPRESSTDGQEYDVTFGRLAMAREVRQAAEDLAVAGARALMRFNGGVEVATFATHRGRGRATVDTQGNPAWSSTYLESSVKVETGTRRVGGKVVSVVDEHLARDPGLTPLASSETGSLFVDRVERRIDIVPGAAGYARQITALDGYDARLRQAANDNSLTAGALQAGVTAADQQLAQRRREREAVARQEDVAWARYHAWASPQKPTGR